MCDKLLKHPKLGLGLLIHICYAFGHFEPAAVEQVAKVGQTFGSVYAAQKIDLFLCFRSITPRRRKQVPFCISLTSKYPAKFARDLGIPVIC